MYEDVENLQTATSKLVVALAGMGPIYWTAAAYLLFILLLGSLLLQLLKSGGSSKFFDRGWARTLTNNAFFMGVLAFTILFLRVPHLSELESSVDESQWMAGANTLLEDPRYWYSVDGNTSGPLVAFPLLLLKLFGTINYGSVKLFHNLIWAVNALLVYVTLRRLFNPLVAGLAVLPLAAFLSTMSHGDFVAYNGESIPVLLLSVSTLLLTQMKLQPEKNHSGKAVLMGVLLGCVPYSKPQAAPIALTLAAFGLVALWPRRKTLLLYVGSGLLPTGLVLLYLVSTNLLQEAFTSYIVNNLIYAGKGGLNSSSKTTAEKVILAWNMIFQDTADIKLLFSLQYWTVLFAGAAVLLLRKKLNRGHHFFAWLGLGLTLSALVSVITPGSGFTHYLLFLVVPLTFWVGTLVGMILQAASQLPEVRLHLLYGLVFGTLSYAAFAVLINNPAPPAFQEAEATNNHNRGKTKSVIARKILEYAREGDQMAIWGWSDVYFVETGLTQGCRDPLIYYHVRSGPLQSFYLNRYAGDLARNKPAFFVDTVAPNEFYFTNREHYGHDIFPGVKAVVEQNYRLLAEIEGVRIYLLKDRAFDGSDKQIRFTKLPQMPAPRGEIGYSVDEVTTDTNMVTISGWAFIQGHNTRGSEIDLVLKGEDGPVVLRTLPLIRSDVSSFFANPYLSFCGYVQYIPRAQFRHKRYQLGILVRGAKTDAFTMTDKTVSF